MIFERGNMFSEDDGEIERRKVVTIISWTLKQFTIYTLIEDKAKDQYTIKYQQQMSKA